MNDLGINDDFGAFWRYLEQAPEMTIELDHRPIFWSLSMSALTSQIEAIQREIVEIHRYITRRPEASTSIDRLISSRNNKSTDIPRHTSVDEATNRGRLVPKVTSEMSDTHNHGEEISADTYATLMRHQFILDSLGDRLQKIENTTATMKEK
uniref:Uncharacterized protein n=1 Tax=Brassica oleracea var. oleracea TaxID=109376 RepID=A0A0D3DMU2_BRAOL